MGEIQASAVIEILGKPEEHVRESIKALITKLGEEKGVKIVNKTLHDPRRIEESKDLFTTFAEVDVELDSLANYFGILFAYMPSHIEITHPEKITLQNSELNELGNVLMQRLHSYDAVTKTTINERNFLLSKIQELSPELFKQLTIPPEQTKSQPENPEKSG